MSKSSREKLRATYLAKIMEFFTNEGLDVLQVKSNEVAIPVLDENGEEEYIVVNVKVPTGSRDNEPYDGYGEAESFAMNQKLKAEKKAESEKKKAEKIARDKAMREKKKAERLAQKGGE